MTFKICEMWSKRHWNSSFFPSTFKYCPAFEINFFNKIDFEQYLFNKIADKKPEIRFPAWFDQQVSWDHVTR